MLISVLSSEVDASLRFFAWAVTRYLSVSSNITSDLLWPSDSTVNRSAFFRALEEFPNNWIQSFYQYICEVTVGLKDNTPRYVKISSRCYLQN